MLIYCFSMAEKNCQNRFQVSFHRDETAAGKSSISSVLISFSLLSLSFRSFLQRKMVKPVSNLCFSSPYLTVLNCAEDMFGASLLRFCRLVRLVRVVKVFRVKYMKDILLVDDYSNFKWDLDHENVGILVINDGWLMISSGIILPYTTQYIGDDFIIQERGIPFLTNQDFLWNKRGLSIHGITSWKSCSPTNIPL